MTTPRDLVLFSHSPLAAWLTLASHQRDDLRSDGPDALMQILAAAGNLH